MLGVDSSAEMIAAAPAGEGVEFTVGDIRDWASAAPTSRSTSSSPTRRCSGSPATSTCFPAWWTRSPRVAGWPSRSPATSPSRATPSARAGRRGGVRRAHRRGGHPRRPRRGDLPAGAAWPRLRGRRLGDDVPARAARGGPGLHLGQRHRLPARRSRRCPTTCARSSRRSSSAACARRTPSATARSCCPSAASSWSPQACRARALDAAAASSEVASVAGAAGRGRTSHRVQPLHLPSVDGACAGSRCGPSPRGPGSPDAFGAGPRRPAGRARCRRRRRRASPRGPYAGTG